MLNKLVDKAIKYFRLKIDVVFIVFIMFVILGVMHHLVFVGGGNG